MTPNNKSQILELKNERRDTSVVPSQTSVIDNINRKNLMEARKQKDFHDREVQKKIDYYKQN